MTSQAANQIVMIVARNIVRAREHLGWTQREMGVPLAMDARGISRWENGHVMPSRTKLAQLAQVVGRDVGWFYVDHDDDEPLAA